MESGPASPGQAGSDELEQVHWLQRVIAGLGVFFAFVIGIAILKSAREALPFLVVPFLPTVWPLFARQQRTFRHRCLVVGTTLCVLGVLLACVGMFFVIPSNVMLLLAVAADPRRKSVLARIRTAVAVGVAGLITAGACVMFGNVLAGPAGYSVEFAGDANAVTGGDGLSGATSVSSGPSGTPGRTRLTITYSTSLFGDERRELREYLESLPDAGPVEDCGRGPCR
ncbi:hypothetical protein ACFYYB_34255 [Streptomyces sp. NPDC002886]|uniref:hypothetical protein n=1 Tax=Streptomyces sp. NPDC002886 TaxID=3364667 RepID=UPI00367D4329